MNMKSTKYKLQVINYIIHK